MTAIGYADYFTTKPPQPGRVIHDLVTGNYYFVFCLQFYLFRSYLSLLDCLMYPRV